MTYFENLNEEDKKIVEMIAESSNIDMKKLQEDMLLSEAPTVTGSTNHPDVVLPLITYVQQDLVAKDLVDIQPIQLKEGKVYGLDIQDTAGNVISGTSAVGTFNDAFSEIAENTDVPTLVLKLKVASVVAKTRKAQLNYSQELSQDFKILKYNFETEKLKAIGTEIAAGIDFDIIEAIVAHSDHHTPITYVWDYTTATDDYLSQLYELKVAIMKASGAIAAATRKGLANFVIVPVLVQPVVSSMPGFVSIDEPKLGPLSKIGKLDYLDVYVNTFDTSTYNMYVGKKPTGNLKSGIVYSPYKIDTLPVVTDAEDFTLSQAIFNRYGITKIDGGNTMYHKVIVTPTAGFPY